VFERERDVVQRYKASNNTRAKNKRKIKVDKAASDRGRKAKKEGGEEKGTQRAKRDRKRKGKEASLHRMGGCWGPLGPLIVCSSWHTIPTIHSPSHTHLHSVCHTQRQGAQQERRGL